MGRPVAIRRSACLAISAPWSQVSERRSCAGNVVIVRAMGIANRFSPMTGKRRPVLHARDGAVAFHSGKMQQHCEPRGAFHQSADRRSAQADDQVAFPVSGYGPIRCFRRSFTDHDLRRDEGFAPPAATCPRHAQCPSPAPGASGGGKPGRDGIARSGNGAKSQPVKPRQRRNSQHDKTGASAGGPQSNDGSPTPLRIPYGNKELAFGLGARYGADGWYAPPGVDLDAFRERGWL